MHGEPCLALQIIYDEAFDRLKCYLNYWYKPWFCVRFQLYFPNLPILLFLFFSYFKIKILSVYFGSSFRVVQFNVTYAYMRARTHTQSLWFSSWIQKQMARNINNNFSSLLPFEHCVVSVFFGRLASKVIEIRLEAIHSFVRCIPFWSTRFSFWCWCEKVSKIPTLGIIQTNGIIFEAVFFLSFSRYKLF